MEPQPPAISEAAWADILAAFRRDHPQLDGARLSALDLPRLVHGELVVSVHDPELLRWLRAHGRQPFIDAAQAVTGHLVAVRFVAAAPPVAPAPEARSDPLLRLNPEYTFENFVTGPENRLAHAAFRAVADAPGTAYNPLFVHGESGMGKTHLLQAVCHEVLRSRPDAAIVYLSCETFVNHFIEAVERGQLHEFRHRYRAADLLLVDDVQFLGRGERSQEEFFHTFNTLYQSRRQIVLSADCPPGDIPALAERLVSRFKSGLVARVDSPCMETRIAILRTKARLMGMAVPEDALAFIGGSAKVSPRELEGALARVRVLALTLSAPVTLDIARQALQQDAASVPSAAVPIDRIVQLVAEQLNVKPPDLRGRRRHRSIALARHICMYLARRMTAQSLEEIGAQLGRRDHSTVLHAHKNIERRRAADPQLNGLLGDLEQRLRQP